MKEREYEEKEFREKEEARGETKVQASKNWFSVGFGLHRIPDY